MKVLAFDTETTGLPVSYNAPLSDSSKWPYIVQLSFIVFDTLKKEILDYSDRIIKLDPDIIITPESIAIHQITPEQSQRDGISIQKALQEFDDAIKDVDLIIGHNIQFDKNMLTVEFHRNRLRNCLYRDGRPINEFCTMKRNIELCKLPFVNHNNTIMSHYKWPTLSELHYCLFNAKPKGTHNAIVDVMICLRCYVYLHHKYDIAFDNDVTIVFRTLYADCLGAVPPDPPSGVSRPLDRGLGVCSGGRLGGGLCIGSGVGSGQFSSEGLVGDLGSGSKEGLCVGSAYTIDTEPAPPSSPPPTRPRRISTRKTQMITSSYYSLFLL